MVTYTFTSLKEYRTSMLVKKQLYLFIFSAACCFLTALNFYPHWILFGLSKVLLGTLGPLFWNFIPVLLFLLLFCHFKRTFFFSTKASALAFSISLKKAFSLASMSAFDFNLSTIRLVGFRTKVVRYLESLFSPLKNLKLLQEISPGQLHQNHACW